MVNAAGARGTDTGEQVLGHWTTAEEPAGTGTGCSVAPALTRFGAPVFFVGFACPESFFSAPKTSAPHGGVWHKALVLVCWRRLLASRHCVCVLSPEDPPSRCVGPPFLFLHGGGSWHPHIKDPNGINLQLCAQH